MEPQHSETDTHRYSCFSAGAVIPPLSLSTTFKQHSAGEHNVRLYSFCFNFHHLGASSWGDTTFSRGWEPNLCTGFEILCVSFCSIRQFFFCFDFHYTTRSEGRKGMNNGHESRAAGGAAGLQGARSDPFSIPWMALFEKTKVPF